MSGHYDPTANVSMPDMMDHVYPMYDPPFAPYPRVTGPPTHLDGVGFWYRPNNNDGVYERDSSMYNRGMSMDPTAMEGAPMVNVKHKRTRSGCFTCRSRRVKCDETRPICERCRKGNRECEFPDSSSSRRKGKRGEPGSPLESAKNESKDGTSSGLGTIKDEDEGTEAPPKPSQRPKLSRVRTQSSQSLSRKQRYRQAPEMSPPSVKDHASPQSQTSSSSHSRAETPATSVQRSLPPSADLQARQAKIKALKPDLQRYLQFQQEHMTHYHYFFKLDPEDFVHTQFIDQALEFEPLLYAAVGFAAYHHEIRQPNARLHRFLSYHSKALSLLRKSLENHAEYTEAMLLTVLQLATFEEFLGDWVNLVGHHRAAHTMLLKLYTPDTVIESDLAQRIFSWYARMDVIAGLMAGNQTQLDRSWYATNATWYEEHINQNIEDDIDLDGILMALVAAFRLLGYDMASLYARLPKQEISIEDFHMENIKIIERLERFKGQIESLNDSFYAVTEFPMAKEKPLTKDDIVDPYVPGGLFRDYLWVLNFMWIDWYAMDLMQKYQASMLLQKPLSPDLESISLEQCRIYEAVNRWPDAPEGACLGAHASLGLAAVFLKKDEKHTMWMRGRLAEIERQGYVFPPKFRSQMAQIWGLSKEQVGEEKSVEDWWLPNGESRSQIFTDIRNVVRERHENCDDGVIMGSEVGDVRDLKAIFARLDLRTSSTADALSPGSEDARSATSTGLNSPSSMTSVSAMEHRDSWGVMGSTQTSSAATAAKVSSGSKNITGAGGDRMSGVWPTSPEV